MIKSLTISSFSFEIISTTVSDCNYDRKCWLQQNLQILIIVFPLSSTQVQWEVLLLTQAVTILSFYISCEESLWGTSLTEDKERIRRGQEISGEIKKKNSVADSWTSAYVLQSHEEYLWKKRKPLTFTLLAVGCPQCLDTTHVKVLFIRENTVKLVYKLLLL